MRNTNIYKTYTLEKTKLIFLLLFILIMFFIYLFSQSLCMKITSNYPSYQLYFLYFLYILNIFFIKIITKRVKDDADDIIFSDINVNLNSENKKIDFSQKKVIIEENEDGFNFYITITSEYNKSTLIKKINQQIKRTFIRFLFDSDYDHIMAKEHWYRVAFATFLYFILFILLLEMINIGKEIFTIMGSENFFYILILLLLIIDFIYIIYNQFKNRYLVKLKKIKFTSSQKLLTLRDFEYHRVKFCKKLNNQFKNIVYLFIFFLVSMSLFLWFIDYKITFNQNYSIVLMLFGLFELLYITSVIIKIIKPNAKFKNLKENDIDKSLLIDIYFNREFLCYADNQISKKSESGMKKNLFYALIGFLFTISVPIIIEEVKTPSVIVDKIKGQPQIKGQPIEQIR